MALTYAREHSGRLPIEAIESAIDANWQAFQKPGVVSVRPGFQFTNGWITKKPAIVVAVRRKRDTLLPGDELPTKIAGYAIDVRQAEPHLQLAFDETPDRFPIRLPAFSVGLEPAEEEADAAPRIPYEPPAGVPLQRIRKRMKIRCCASPDSGFDVLRDFLAGTRQRLVIGMYEFSVRHIVNAPDSCETFNNSPYRWILAALRMFSRRSLNTPGFITEAPTTLRT